MDKKGRRRHRRENSQTGLRGIDETTVAAGIQAGGSVEKSPARIGECYLVRQDVLNRPAGSLLRTCIVFPE